MIPDLINGSFEILAGFFILNHCRVLFKSKKVRGVSVVSAIFFTAWGLWNLFYYPHLGQWLSFYGGIAVVVTNSIWVSMMIYYKRKEKDLNENFSARWNKR